MFKLIIFLTIFISTAGFKVFISATWDIEAEDPTLWVKFCDDMQSLTFESKDIPSGDPLDGTTPTFTTLSQSIIDDFNNVTHSYIRLARYPADPDNPGTPVAGDSTFTEAAAETRTIDVCVENSSNPFSGGHALPILEEGALVGCKIVLSEKSTEETPMFIATLTHELGHCLTLDHPQETVHSVMSYFKNAEKIRLQSDDKMGLVYLFPTADYDNTETATFGLSCGI